MVSLLIAAPLLTLQVAARVYLMQGDRFLAQNQLEKAINSYSTATKLQANFATVYLRLGKALQKNQQFTEALKAYNQAFLINPDLTVQSDLASDLTRLGAVLLKKGNVSEAIIAYQIAVAIDPLAIEANHNLGKALAQQQRWQEAGQAFNQVILFDPDNAQAYTNLGNALFKQEKWHEAKKIYEKALELTPKDALIHQRLAEILVEIGEFNSAETLYLKALALAPNQGDLYNGLGQVLYEQKKVDEAINAYQKAIKLSPNNPEIYKNFCFARHTQHQYEEALKLCRQAMTLNPAEGGAKFYVMEVERALAILKNPNLLQMPERIPSPQTDPYISYKRSIVKVVIKSSNYQGVGTGWVLKREGKNALIVTNRHVVTNPEQKQEQDAKIEVELYSQPPAGQIRKRIPAHLLEKTDPNDWLDIAVLKVTDLPQDIQPLSLSSVSPPEASKIEVIGHPITGDDWSVASGQVQSVTEQELYLSVVLASGNSGGPVLDSNYQVIGVVVKAGLFCPQTSSNNQINVSLLNKLGCGIAFPIELVQERLNQWGI
ncbi:serine protease [Gloeothece citriformis]|uniref:serine protease n=1 Tax=Gloeothece citriformis TaxID=2546356 RepID=UPI0002FB0D47|nr:serine protease [Gloeothece citriformis]